MDAYLAARAGTNAVGYTTFAQVIGDPNFAMSSKLFSAFWQDDWRVAPDIKVLYGVRYDAYFYPAGTADAPFAYSQKFANDTNNFGPRLGVAWTLAGEEDHVIRASTGIMYDQPLLATYQNSIQENGLPARTTYSVNANGVGAPDFPNTLANLPAGVTAPAQSIFAPDPGLKLAYNCRTARSTTARSASAYHASVGVVYNRGYNLPVITDINLINPTGTLADGRNIYSTSVNANTRMDPRFNHINVVQSPGTSTYKALLLTFGKRFSNGMQYDFNYTLGKGIETRRSPSTLAVQGDSAALGPTEPRIVTRAPTPSTRATRSTAASWRCRE